MLLLRYKLPLIIVTIPPIFLASLPIFLASLRIILASIPIILIFLTLVVETPLGQSVAILPSVFHESLYELFCCPVMWESLEVWMI